MAQGSPKPAFFLAVLLVVGGLIGLALWRFGALPGVKSAKNDAAKQASGIEAADSQSITTTVKQYTFQPAQKRPAVKGISKYSPMADRTVRFAINVWAGWAPIIYANNGFKPGKVWKIPGGKDFKVELTLIDDPVAMRDAYAAGNVHVGWGTSTWFLCSSKVSQDSRVMPHLSAGGLVQWRRRDRGSPEHQDLSGPSRQDSGSTKTAVPLLRSECLMRGR
jgi:hypothetical protein